ncbi:hypothetical protein P7K49_037575 [Saguinus oedipus]|uniref:Uncharacterized protein n=1 Tax=Saguinus oedipus TaxID=9490 RepID=A0ABQ9TIF2_SAGOE|nr:hypothetical protein P7K49_037575 [Saguinus oedipus]
MEKAANHLSSDLCIFPDPASQGFPLPQAHPTPQGGVALTCPTVYLSEGARLASPGTLPSLGATRMWYWSKDLHKPQAPPSRKYSRPRWGPSFSRSTPHLFCGHRPLPRAANAALAGATAVLRHLRRLLGFRPAQLSPRLASRPAYELPPTRPGASGSRPPSGSARILRMVLAVSSCRTYSLSRRPQGIPLAVL